MTYEQIEELENKYLEKFFHFLKYCEDEILEGFKTKEAIKRDWEDHWGSKISDFTVGAERVIYALFNGKGIGTPNSAPVGSDLFFEVKDAYIHIDLKTVTSKNIEDFKESIFVGRNQNSYAGKIIIRGEEDREYKPALPCVYNRDKEYQKICLTYFITVLYDQETLEIFNINLLSMPNGDLHCIYGDKILKAGKSKESEKDGTVKGARFNFSQCPDFSYDKNKKRIKVIYFKENLPTSIDTELKFLKNIYQNQNK